MSEHDVMCPVSLGDPFGDCECKLLADTRADEDEKIAKAIRASGANDVLHPDFMMLAATLKARHARIAQNGGRDE